VNIQLKQRLVGAIVLVALAVIFIPMLLPGEGDLGGGIDGSNIPAEPDYRFSPMATAPDAPPMAVAANMPLSEEALTKVIETENRAAKMPLNTKTATAKAAVAEKAPKQTVKPAKKITTRLRQLKAADRSGWVVQVGSFSSSRNAKALRDKLRKQGHASFVETLDTAAGAVYRVRIGPEVSRQSAERLRLKLAKTQSLQGLVQAYP
jgi:DedD protein